MAGYATISKTEEGTVIYRLINEGRMIDAIEVEHLYFVQEKDLMQLERFTEKEIKKIAYWGMP